MDEQNLDKGVSGIHAVLLSTAAILPLGPPRSQCQPPAAPIVTCGRPQQTVMSPCVTLQLSRLTSPYRNVKNTQSVQQGFAGALLTFTASLSQHVGWLSSACIQTDSLLLVACH